MLNVTDEQKKMFCDDRYYHNYVFRFPDIDLTFDNEQLYSESVTLKESICDEEELKLGGCIASSIEFTVSEIMAQQIAGITFSVEMNMYDENRVMRATLPMGKYVVDTVEQSNDKDYKKATAYDLIYEASVDVSSWYNDYFEGDTTHTVKETRESLLTYLGIPFVEQTLPNDGITLEKTIEPNGNLSGTTVLKAICEINGTFGRMNRYGKFEEIQLQGLGLYPEDSLGESENLYPSETIFPEDNLEYLGISDDDIRPQYRNVTYSEYITVPVTCVNIQTTSDDVGVTVGDDISNPYVITSNILLYGKSTDDLKAIGRIILSCIKGIVYRPNTTELDGLPYMECGDVYSLEKKNDIVESYIFSRSLKGIQALIDSYESKGNKIRSNDVSSNGEIQQLKGKTLILKKSIDEVSSNLKDFADNTESKFAQTNEKIESTVGLLKKKWIVPQDFGWNPYQIIRSDGKPNIEEYPPAVYPNFHYIDNLTGKTYKSKYISEMSMAVWALGDTLTEYEVDDIQTQISQMAKSIVMSINTADGTVSMISMDGNSIDIEGVVIDLSAKKISIKSNTLEIDEDGNIKGADISGSNITGSEFHLEKTIELEGEDDDGNKEYITYSIDIADGTLTMEIPNYDGGTLPQRYPGTTTVEMGNNGLTFSFDGGFAGEPAESSYRSDGATVDGTVECENLVVNQRVDGSLVVEDELAAKDMVCETLTICGYVFNSCTEIIEISESGSGSLTLSAPGISMLMPANACNADNAANSLIIRGVIIDEANGDLICSYVNAYPGNVRISYSYWSKANE